MNRVWNHGRTEDPRATTEMSIASNGEWMTCIDPGGTTTPASLGTRAILGMTLGETGVTNTGADDRGTVTDSAKTGTKIRLTEDQDTKIAGRREGLKNPGVEIDGGDDTRTLEQSSI